MIIKLIKREILHANQINLDIQRKKKLKKKFESPDKLHTASKVKKDLEKPKSSNFRLSGFSYKSCFPPN